MSNNLQQLRQYMHYHIHASKSYLHSRIRRRVDVMLRKLIESKYEEELNIPEAQYKDELDLEEEGTKTQIGAISILRK